MDTKIVPTIAQICYEANRVYCQSIGDNSQPCWEDAADWQKESVYNGVMYHIENPIPSPSLSHENWLKVKYDEGWSYGPVKDVENKKHPCMVPYDNLPEEQQMKDHIFTQLVNTLYPLFTKQ